MRRRCTLINRLGICLGLQVLYEDSEESPGVPGLGILPGKVRRFDLPQGYKVPQIGWNQVQFQKPDCPLFADVNDETFFYFVHSYYVDSPAGEVVAGTTNYGLDYTSVVWKENLMAAQFHLEKSQKYGLKMLSNFGRWAFRERVSP